MGEAVDRQLDGPAYHVVNGSVAPATAPWLPAKVYYVNDREPNCEECGTTDMLHIHGTNLAPSPFLFLNYASAAGNDMVQYATSGKDSGVLARAGCAQGTFMVTAHNCYAPGDDIDTTLVGEQVENSGQFSYDVNSAVVAHWTLDVSASSPDGGALDFVYNNAGFVSEDATFSKNVKLLRILRLFKLVRQFKGNARVLTAEIGRASCRERV